MAFRSILEKIYCKIIFFLKQKRKTFISLISQSNIPKHLPPSKTLSHMALKKKKISTYLVYTWIVNKFKYKVIQKIGQ